MPAPEGKSPKTADPIWRPTPWVFISSVGEGADEYRASVQRACLRKRMLPIAMESWSAAAKSPAEVCRAHVQECDVMVLLLLHRYGSIEPTTGKSYTELEYEAAHAAGRDILAFEITSMSKVKPLSLDPDDLRRLQQFSAGMKSQLRCKVASAGELEAAVFQALDEWRRQGEREEVR